MINKLLKNGILSAILLIAVFVFSCKKDSPPTPSIAITDNLTQGTSNASGEYTLTGLITSAVKLDKVVITKEGDSQPYIIDDSTPKNKLEYSFSYQFTAITKNTNYIIDIYDLNGGVTTIKFLVIKG